jgi:hypothetical protein
MKLTRVPISSPWPMLSRVGLFRNLPNLDTPTRYYIYKQQPERSSLRCFNLLLHQRHLVPTVTMRSSFITSLLSVVTAVYGYADPMGCSGVCTNAHDPALIRRDDGTYYRFSTGGKIAIHTAPTIVGPWTYKGAAIPAGSIININGKNDLWVSHMLRWVTLREQAD